VSRGFIAMMIAGALVGVVVLYWIAIGGLSQPSAPAWLTAGPFAHRGHHFEVQHPENSLAAFRSAAEAGYGVELDVHLTSDGQAVVIHDDTLWRTTGDPRNVADTSFADIRALRLQHTAEQIPTLAEALATVGGRVPVLVEIKSRGGAGRLEEIVALETGSYRGKLAIMSFNPLSLHRIAQLVPQIPRGQISGLFADSGLPAYQTFVLQHLLLNVWSRPDFIVYDFAAMPSWDASAQRSLGRPLLVYTPATLADAQLATAEADNYIGDPGSLPR
jgi:glycerophosphoryl diester phosphodiesterase